MMLRIVLLGVFIAFNKTFGQECSADGDLCDDHKDCSIWAKAGECQKNEVYMKKTCPVSCLDDNYPTKDEDKCKDYHSRCHVWATLGECTENPKDMKRYCAKSCNLCKADGSGEVIEEVCVDKHDSCSFWTTSGECDDNPEYMLKNCAKSCGTCPRREEKKAPEENIAAEKTIAAEENIAVEENKAAGENIVQGGEVKVTLTDDEKKLVELSATFGETQKVSGAEYTRTLANIRETLEYLNDEDESFPESIMRQCKNKHELCSFWAGMEECEKNEPFMISNCSPSCQGCDLLDERG